MTKAPFATSGGRDEGRGRDLHRLLERGHGGEGDGRLGVAARRDDDVGAAGRGEAVELDQEPVGADGDAVEGEAARVVGDGLEAVPSSSTVAPGRGPPVVASVTVPTTAPGVEGSRARAAARVAESSRERQATGRSAARKEAHGASGASLRWGFGGPIGEIRLSGVGTPGEEPSVTDEGDSAVSTSLALAAPPGAASSSPALGPCREFVTRSARVHRARSSP